MTAEPLSIIEQHIKPCRWSTAATFSWLMYATKHGYMLKLQSLRGPLTVRGAHKTCQALIQSEFCWTEMLTRSAVVQVFGFLFYLWWKHSNFADFSPESDFGHLRLMLTISAVTTDWNASERLCRAETFCFLVWSVRLNSFKMDKWIRSDRQHRKCSTCSVTKQEGRS